MEDPHPTLRVLLLVVAVLQMALALLNLGLVRILGWKQDLERLPLLIREVFHVHSWFISLTCALFGVITWRFGALLSTAGSDLGRWLCAGIAIFWGVRAVIQVAYYSPSHWKGKPHLALAHVGFLVLYGGFTTVYGWTAMTSQ